MVLLHLEGIGKSFQQGELEVKALQNITLNIEEGEFAALVGPSGSGKTTLLNIIGGLDSPTEGKAMLNDVDMSTLSEAQLSDFRLLELGFVFQAYNLVPVLSALENVELAAKNYGEIFAGLVSCMEDPSADSKLREMILFRWTNTLTGGKPT